LLLVSSRRGVRSLVSSAWPMWLTPIRHS
jgi:hypothetical protein